MASRDVLIIQTFFVIFVEAMLYQNKDQTFILS